MGKKEIVKNTARVLGRYYDGIPVWNGLTDLYHLTQILADMLTIKYK